MKMTLKASLSSSTKEIDIYYGDPLLYIRPKEGSYRFPELYTTDGFDIVGFQCGFEHCIIVAQCNQFDLCRFEFAGRYGESVGEDGGHTDYFAACVSYGFDCF